MNCICRPGRYIQGKDCFVNKDVINDAEVNSDLLSEQRFTFLLEHGLVYWVG